jgi:hypothetical protein
VEKRLVITRGQKENCAYLDAIYSFLLCFFVWLCDFVLFFGVVIALVLGSSVSTIAPTILLI